MTRNSQLSLFGEDSEPDLLGPGYSPPVYRADPDEVRAELNKILAEARAAAAFPWPRDRADLYRLIFPQMARWLPDEEAAQLCFAFEQEMERLAAA